MLMSIITVDVRVISSRQVEESIIFLSLGLYNYVWWAVDVMTEHKRPACAF